MRLVRGVTAASGRVARSTAAQGFASRQSEVASPAGLEPATCGLEIRCCYPAELRGRAGKLLPKIVSAGQRRKGVGHRTSEGGCADHVRLRLYRPVRN